MSSAIVASYAWPFVTKYSTFPASMQHSPLQLQQKLIDTVDDKYHVKSNSRSSSKFATTSSSTSNQSSNVSTPPPRKKFKANHNSGFNSNDQDSIDFSPPAVLFDTDPTSQLSSSLPLPIITSTPGDSDDDEDDDNIIMKKTTKLGFFNTYEESRDTGLFGEDYDESLHHHHHRLLATDGELFQEEEEADDEDVDSSRQIIDVDTLHTQQVPNVNGNLDADGQFHEWHETYSVQSTSGTLLHILPYTVIDF